MRGFVGIGHSDHVETAIEEATAGLKKADLLVLIAPFAQAEEAAALLSQKYPGVPMIGTSGESIAKGNVLNKQIVVIGFAGVSTVVGLIEDVRETPVKSMQTFLSDIERIEAGRSNTICLEFVTGCEERVLSTVNAILKEADIPLIGASAYGVPLGEKHLVICNGKIYHRTCVYAFIKNNGGKIRLYRENIYARQDKRAHFANLVEPGTKTLFQLDGRPALEVYEEATGVAMEDLVSNMPRQPLGRALGDDTCIIQTISVDRNGVMFNGKAIYENDSIYIMKLLDFRAEHEAFLETIKQDSERNSFILGFDSVNRFRLFAEEGYLQDYISSFSEVANTVLFIGEGQQYENQHMNQTLVCAVFE